MQSRPLTFGLLKELLNEVRNACVAANYENNWIVKRLKTKSSPNRKHKAAIYVEYDLDQFRIYAIIYNKTGEQIQKQLTGHPLTNQDYPFILALQILWFYLPVVFLCIFL